ncbi:MAG: hypothetical protein ACREKH_00055 [Candidatus Rokuibacteriota bacterium]
MTEKHAPRRAILVNWVYNDGDDGSNAFIERVLATSEEEAHLRQRLFSLTDPSVDGRKRRGAIYDLYVGPEQSVPTPFEDFCRELDSTLHRRARGAEPAVGRLTASLPRASWSTEVTLIPASTIFACPFPSSTEP